jgi:hypothetical protein
LGKLMRMIIRRSSFWSWTKLTVWPIKEDTMRIRVLGFLCLAAVSLVLFGQIPPLSPPEWRSIRQSQPEGLQLKLTLPKDHFYQGEMIKASLEFSNLSPTPYHLWTGNYDRSGRIPDIAFYAQDVAEQPVPDPLAWYFVMGGMGGGMGNFQDLGKWTIALPVNQWLRFDKPGVYTLYAWSNRVQKGPKQHPPGLAHRDAGIPLVSDKVEITIDPLSSEMEQQIIAQAKTDIARGGGLAAPALARLRYLQTPAARAELIPLLADRNLAFDAAMGLCAAPDPGSEAPEILTAVGQGQLPLRGDITSFYSRLKMYDFVAKFLAQKNDPLAAQRFGREMQTTMTQAQDEITAAALKAPVSSIPPSKADGSGATH